MAKFNISESKLFLLRALQRLQLFLRFVDSVDDTFVVGVRFQDALPDHDGLLIFAFDVQVYALQVLLFRAALQILKRGERMHDGFFMILSDGGVRRVDKQCLFKFINSGLVIAFLIII